jgi:hypothetical protein
MRAGGAFKQPTPPFFYGCGNTPPPEPLATDTTPDKGVRGLSALLMNVKPGLIPVFVDKPGLQPGFEFDRKPVTGLLQLPGLVSAKQK